MYAKILTKKAERTLTPHRDFDVSDNGWDVALARLIDRVKDLGVNTIEHPLATGTGAAAGGLYGLLGRDHMADTVRRGVDKATSGGSFDPLRDIIRKSKSTFRGGVGGIYGGVYTKPNPAKRLAQSIGRFGREVGRDPSAIPRALQATVARGANSKAVSSLSEFFRKGAVPGVASSVKLRGRVGTTAAALGAILGTLGAHRISNLGD